MLAKCEGTADLVELAEYEVIALCETARGVLAAPRSPPCRTSRRSCGAPKTSSPRSAAHRAGSTTGDIATSRGTPGPRCCLAAAAHGVAAIDTVHLDIGDLDGLRAEVDDAAALGFAATACIHPSQVAVVREAYRPDPERLEWARAVLAAATTEGGVFAFRGGMVDAPVLRQAEALIRRIG